VSTRTVLAAVLCFEAVVVWLFVPAAVVVADVPLGVALTVGIALGLACLFVAGLLRRRSWPVAAGGVLQVLTVALGFVVPAMFVIGGIFALLWVATLRLGRRIDEMTAARERAAAAPDADAGAPRADGGATPAG
jgi:hypothetical protein